jgi:hypothetical protein
VAHRELDGADVSASVVGFDEQQTQVLQMRQVRRNRETTTWFESS